MATKDGKKTGGRKKGTPNQTSLALHEIFNELGINVPERIYECICELEKIQETEALLPADLLKIIGAKSNIYLEIMQYLFPKRKAVEIKNAENEVLEVVVSSQQVKDAIEKAESEF